jgi:hypothetical protein
VQGLIQELTRLKGRGTCEKLSRPFTQEEMEFFGYLYSEPNVVDLFLIPRSKRRQQMSYMKFIDCVFPLNALLNGEYWTKHHKAFAIKLPHLQPCLREPLPFINLSTGSVVERLTWRNSID